MASQFPPVVSNDPNWPVEAVRELIDLTRQEVSAEVVSLKLHKPVIEVTAKAAQLGLRLRPVYNL